MRFPKKLFVKISGRKGQEWHEACASLEGMVDVGKKEVVAVYRLSDVLVATAVYEIRKKTPRRKR